MAQTAFHWAREATAWKYSVTMTAAAFCLPVVVMKSASTAVARTRAQMVYRSIRKGLCTVAAHRKATRHRSGIASDTGFVKPCTANIWYWFRERQVLLVRRMAVSVYYIMK